MRTKHTNSDLTKLKRKNTELKKALEAKTIEIEALEHVIKMIDNYYNINVKKKFRIQAIYQIHKAKNYSIKFLCTCFGCKRDTYYKGIQNLDITKEA